MARISVQEYGADVCAFLDMIAKSEGTADVPGSDDGYNVLVGGTLFHDYTTHPLKDGILIEHLGYKSTAAGRYQLLHRYWDAYCKELHLMDFSPVSQDLIALQQMREQGALSFLNVGDIGGAINACRNIWASLPNAGYGQHENSLPYLEAVYEKELNTSDG